MPAERQALPSSTQGDLPSISARAPQANDWFEDVTERVGIQAGYETGRSAGRNTILETVGGGVGLVDYDLDSLLDIYTVGGGTIDPVTSVPSGVPGHLFRQAASESFKDTTVEARITVATDYSHGILAGDIDNDGFPDLLLTCYGRCELWRNLGDGTFYSDSEPAGLTVSGWHTAAAFLDLNSDGNLDLYVASYVSWSPDNRTAPEDVPPPQQFAPQADHLFMNQGNGRFEEMSQQAGIRSDGMGLGVLACDLNDDGVPDLYVANDVVGNHLYLGRSEFPLAEIGEASGLAYNELGTPEGSMGVDADDISGDGLPDVWVTNFELEDNSLYLNLGHGQFQHATSRMGLVGIGRHLVGFGTGFQDFDGDSWPDLYVLNGHVQYHSRISPYRQSAYLLRNRDGQRFEDVSARAGSWFSIPHSARGGAAGDWNNDGAIDLVVSSLDEPLVVLRNRLVTLPPLHLRLVGRQSSRDPIGAKVSISRPSRNLVHFVKSGSGYLSQSDSRIVIPIEPIMATVEIIIHWPSMRRERFSLAAQSGYQVLVEGHGTDLD